ncbi:MAG TPA: GNAT family N-acetyltransferase [Flavobacteriaceae bacterium]|nr:GNAT family N-acetyltransferase [Flavobacteriaceae bacterium]
MINISEHIQLQDILIHDQAKLEKLVDRVYKPVYKHLWKNENYHWYINRFYSKENLEKELNEPESEYYFVIYKSQDVGILRIDYNRPLIGYKKESHVYLHRIYLGTEAQGQGIGKALFDWVEQRAKEKGKSSIWLKAMDTQEQALRFYAKLGYENIGKTYLNFEQINRAFNGMIIFWKQL